MTSSCCMDPVYPDVDILISGGTLLTMDDRLTVIENPLIGIREGEIVHVGPYAEALSRHPRAQRVDADGCLILPGLVNTHTHAPMVAFRGLADDLPLMDWLNNHIFPAEAKYVNPDMVHSGALLAAAEMLLSGTTTFADGYFHEDRVAEAAIQAGIRAVVAEGFIDFSPPGDREIANHLRRAGQFAERWTSESSLITPAIFCHSAYNCSSRTLRSLKELARSAGLTYFIHVSETMNEVRLMLEREGNTPVHYLDRIGVLDSATVAVHCVAIDDGEIEKLSACNVSVSHTPESNMKLACGIAPVPKLLSKKITVGLGTDGCASNNDLDLFMEMDTAAKVHKVASMDATVMDDISTLTMATRGGAKVLGLDDKIGSIEVGKRADLIFLDLARPHLTPMYNPYSHVVYSATGADVVMTMVDGKIVMKNRVLLTLDVNAVMSEVRILAGKISRDK